MNELSEKEVKWNGQPNQEAIALLKQTGKVIVCPTKVGYIVAVSDKEGLERKFSAKNRKRNKPGVVLCSSLEQLYELAEVTSEIAAVYQECWEKDILFGAILPWKEAGKAYIPQDGSDELMTDVRGTSCFVVKFGVPGEQISKELWDQEKKLLFASSANPSGKGNRGLVEGIGEKIANEADLIIEGNDYVASIQPDKTIETRYEQGVMVSFVDRDGNLIPEQGTARSITPAPVLIRKGLDVDKIQSILSEQFNSWDYRHGEYY
ncbi:L-threonylcarbamoyladenylate synthase [Enterococcus dongliensis]|uniref:L-threonylcarbamoyladenylate synthase n=1 Tax=Enterococcus dongliensis TaxID=2559925 RepID=UPI00288D0D41|nr:Sua5/YciO/YrdC/YwlC family protein [Enterococcus dongliensis]MDT2613685.1 Sua5/YciO/YrdC/YwlC family protein [Enterococcus dongliensis]